MPKRIVIIGAGPIGLEAALYARTLGHEVVVFERGEVADNIAKWGFVRLFSPWLMCITSLGHAAVQQVASAVPFEQIPTGRDFRELYLLPLSRSPILCDTIRQRTEVLSIKKEPNHTAGFQIRAQDPAGQQYTEHADILLDCSGTYTHFRWAGDNDRPAPGEEALQDRIYHTLPDVLGRDRARFANRHTLLIGCNYTSAMVLRDLKDLVANCPHTAVTWAVRRPDQPVHPVLNDPLHARGRLVESTLRILEHPPAWLRFLSTAVLQSITANDSSFHAVFHSNGKFVSLMPDEVVSLVGFHPDISIYSQLQLQTTYATTGPMKLTASLLSDTTIDGLVTEADVTGSSKPEPTFFLLGAKSYGPNSNFLLQAGHMQICDAFRMIEGKADLDLYE
jgi:hypothetical protein